MAGELGFDTGPFVNVATFCDQAIQDKDGVLTIVRVIDQMTLTATGPTAPEELPPGGAVNLTLVVALKAGQAHGKQDVKIEFEHPDGSKHPGPAIPVHFSGGAGGGANAIFKITLVLSSAGLYWADVLVNGRLVSRVPLEVRYQVIPQGVIQGP